MFRHPIHSFTTYLSPNVVAPNPLLHHLSITQCCNTQPIPSPLTYHPMLWHPTHSFTNYLSPNVVVPNPLLHHSPITQCSGTQPTPSPLICHPMLWHPTHSFTTDLSPNFVTPKQLLHHLSITQCCGIQSTPSPLIYHPMLWHPTHSFTTYLSTNIVAPNLLPSLLLHHPRITCAISQPPTDRFRHSSTTKTKLLSSPLFFLHTFSTTAPFVLPPFCHSTTVFINEQPLHPQLSPLFYHTVSYFIE